jgi:type II secretory pathway pseudopilin PulG
MKKLFSKNRKIILTPPSQMAGFTMVETLVAISILLVVIIGPMTIAQKGIQNAYFSRDQLTAVFLAQEAIEAVREKRDERGLYVYDKLAKEEDTSDETWDWITDQASVDPICFKTEDADDRGDKECIFDPSTGNFESCTSSENNDCSRLRVRDDGTYTYEGGIGTNPSLFTRKVYITNNGSSAKINVVVAWSATALGRERSVDLQTWVYDRYKHYEN